MGEDLVEVLPGVGEATPEPGADAGREFWEKLSFEGVARGVTRGLP